MQLNIDLIQWTKKDLQTILQVVLDSFVTGS